MPGWLNATHGTGYPDGALFLDVSADHRRLALEWLRGLTDRKEYPSAVRGVKSQTHP